MDCNSRSATILGYALAVNKLFEMRKYPNLADLADKTNMMSKIIHAREHEENIARQQSPLTKEMYFEMAKQAKISSQDSIDSVLFGFFNLIRVGGFRVAEYAQKTQTKIDEFEYGLGNKVVKAFVPTDRSFYDADGHLVMLHSLDESGDPPKKLKIKFRTQKNCQNGQTITFAADDKHPHICPVRSVYRIFLCAKRLGQADNQPMGVYVNHQGLVKYLTGNKISELLQVVAKNVIRI